MRGELIPIYSAAGKRNVTPPQMDVMEIWEVAAFFSVGMDDDDGDLAAPPRVVPYSQGGQDPNLAARIARAQGRSAEDVIVSSYHPRLGVLN